MARDYKNVTATPPKTKSTKKAKTKGQVGKSTPSLPGWLLLISGVIIGGFVSFLIFLKMNINPEEANVSSVEKETVKKIDVKPELKTSSEAEKPDENSGEEDKDWLEFYTILRDREVVVPSIEKERDQEKAKKEQSEKPSSGSKEKSEYNYVLQAGSFYRFKDADKRKATLALMGVSSKIHVVHPKEGKTLYRVRIGPYENISQINEIESLLNQNKINTLLLKVRG